MRCIIRTMLTEHIQIIKIFGNRAAFARALNVGYETVRKWEERNKIPARYWLTLIEYGKQRGVYLTTELLAEIIDIRKHKKAPVLSSINTGAESSVAKGH